MRDILTGLAALLAVALLALMVGPRFVEWDRHRDEIAARLSARTGIETRIGGHLSITLLPTPMIEAAEVELGPAAAPLVKAKRVMASVSPLALLAGRIVFPIMEIDGVDVMRGAFAARAGESLPDEIALARVGIEQLGLRDLRFPEPGAAPGEAFNATVEAPSLVGPFRVQVQDIAGARDFRGQIGRFEGGRARLKGLYEDKGLASRVSLDGWFALPGPGGRPLFDGAAVLNGNPVIGGAEGTQLAFQGGARLLVQPDQFVADPVNITLGSPESGVQLSGQLFAEMRERRPHLHMKLGARRVDAGVLFGAEDNASPKRQVRPEALLGQLGALPFDGVLELQIGAVQVPGATINDLTLRAGLEAGAVRLQEFQALLPGATRARYRAGTGGAGTLEMEAGELQVLAGWLRGHDGLANLPASAKLALRVTPDSAGLALSDIRLESPAGVLAGSGHFAREGDRPLPRLALDLAAPRFDARVLAALDPLRPIPGIELATKLKVARLAIDGQEMGGLEVSLDREGRVAHLRQLVLTGRRGEQVALSGTASGDTVSLTGKLDAERLGDITELGRAILPGGVTDALARRASLLEPAIAIGNFRLVSRGGDATWDVQIEGKLGGTSLKTTSQSTLRGSDIALALDGEFANPDGNRLAAQLSGSALPPGGPPGRLAVKAEGNPRRAVQVKVSGALAGAEIGFDGTFNPFRAMPLDGRLTLASREAAALGQALGLPWLGTREAQGSTLAARLLGERGKVTLAALDARLGGVPVAGEISFDLERAGQVAGQIRLDTIALPSLLDPVFGAGWLPEGLVLPGRAFAPPTPVPFAGDLWIDAKKGVFGRDAEIEGPQFVLRFAPGLVAFEGFEARLGDARLTGNLTAARKGGQVELGGRLAFLRVPLPVFGGKLGGELPFQASGGSWPELISGLSGAGKVTLDDLAIPNADPLALSRVAGLPLDSLLPASENSIGALVDRELRKGEFRASGLASPLSIVNGQIRAGGPALAAERRGMTTPTFLVDLARREAELRLAFADPQAAPEWNGVAPEITLALVVRDMAKGGPAQRHLQVAALVNGILARAIQRDLERAEAFEADVREREAQWRRQRGDAFIERRAREIREAEIAIETEAREMRRKAEAAAELEALLRREQAQKPPPASAPPLDLSPKPAPAPPG